MLLEPWDPQYDVMTGHVDNVKHHFFMMFLDSHW